MKTIEALVNGQVVASVSGSRWELSLNHIINYVSMYEETEDVELRVYNSDEEVKDTLRFADDLTHEEEERVAFSDSDFVRWQEDREKFLETISSLQGEVRYCQTQAMGSGNRD